MDKATPQQLDYFKSEAQDTKLLYQNEPIKKRFQQRVKWQELPERMIFSNVVDLELPNNKITTGKYNALTFIPQDLLVQFSKIANVYFLVEINLQFFDNFSLNQN